MGDSDGLLGAVEMLKLCTREHKKSGAAFFTTARELWAADQLRHQPSISSITARITKFKRDCVDMPFLHALANVKDFKQFGRPPLASVADMKAWGLRHKMTENAVLRERLHLLKTERGTAGKLSNRTLWLYQRKIRGIQNRAVAANSRAVPPVKQRHAPAPKQYNHHKGTRGLHLVLKGIYYDSMVVGYKDKEYRYPRRFRANSFRPARASEMICACARVRYAVRAILRRACEQFCGVHAARAKFAILRRACGACERNELCVCTRAIRIYLKSPRSRLFKAYWIKRLCHKDSSFKEFDFVTFSRGYTKTKFCAPFLGNRLVHCVDPKFAKIVDLKQFPPKKNGYFEISVGEPRIL